MTLRTAARLGAGGSAMPIARIAVWFVVAAVVGQPLANTPFRGYLLPLALPLLAPAAMFGFLVVLNLVSAGVAPPSRLSDAALTASTVAMVALALNLRWADFPRHFAGRAPLFFGLPAGVMWLVADVFVPIAWLVFLATFVRWPESPPVGASSRAAGWLALGTCMAGLWALLNFAGTLAIFCSAFPPRGGEAYFAWAGLMSEMLEVAQWVLLTVFALALWRMRPAGAPAASD